MKRESDILIGGGGVVGSTLALALAQADFSVTLIDSAPPSTSAQSRFDGRAYALNPASCTLLSTLGMRRLLAECGQPISSVVVSEGQTARQTGRNPLRIAQDDLEQENLGMVVEDHDLRHGLEEKLAATGKIRRKHLETIVDHEREGMAIRAFTDSGQVHTAGLLVASDGRTGRIAKQAGIDRLTKPYRQSAVVCSVEHEIPHEGVARQFFLPTGPFAILPLRKNHSSVIWTDTEANSRSYETLDDAEFLQLLHFRFDGIYGSLALDGPRLNWRLSMSVAERMAADRFALVGDAAHGIHPLAGQGLNLGFKDVAALIDVLVAARRRGEDFGSETVLERYHVWRRFDVVSMAAAVDGFNQLFSNSNPLLKLVRAGGLRAAADLPTLRRAFAREAAGLTGSVPSLLAGSTP